MDGMLVTLTGDYIPVYLFSLVGSLTERYPKPYCENFMYLMAKLQTIFIGKNAKIDQPGRALKIFVGSRRRRELVR